MINQITKDKKLFAIGKKLALLVSKDIFYEHVGEAAIQMMAHTHLNELLNSTQY